LPLLQEFGVDQSGPRVVTACGSKLLVAHKALYCNLAVASMSGVLRRSKPRLAIGLITALLQLTTFPVLLSV
jgi:hypothetical protein